MLRYCILSNRSGPRTVVFDTGGTIELVEPIRVEGASYSDLTIAGQTAPGGGIQIKRGGDRLSDAALIFEKGTANVILRFLRLRSYSRNGEDNIKFIGENLIMDHMSIQYADDENVSIWRTEDNCADLYDTPSCPTATDQTSGDPDGKCDADSGWQDRCDTQWLSRNITIQRSISAYGHGSHSCGLLAGGHHDPREFGMDLRKITLWRNLFASNNDRNPRVTAGTGTASDGGMEVINNVSYNWQIDRAGSTTRFSTADFVSNYFRFGPARTGNDEHEDVLRHEVVLGHCSTTTWNYCDEDGDCPGSETCVYLYLPHGQIYSYGNTVDGTTVSHSSSSTDWDDVWNQTTLESATKYALDSDYRRSTALAAAPHAATAVSASAAYADVLADVGANARVDCEGYWHSNLDWLDDGIIDDVIDRAGDSALQRHCRVTTTTKCDDDGDCTGSERCVVHNPSREYGWPTLSAGTACTDADGDHLPDAFENEYSSTIDYDDEDTDGDSTDDYLEDADGDGYTNLEEWMNGIQCAWCDWADINRDGNVDYADFIVMMAEWNEACSAYDWCSGADINRSGEVGMDDYIVLCQRWNDTGCAGTQDCD
jgi:pectate lyase